VRWDAPGLHRLDVGVTPVGHAEERGIRREGSHLLTPETEMSTHYFFANSRNYRLDDEQEDQAIREWHRIGFGEQDKPMIQAVQRMMGSNELMSLKPVLLPIDSAAVRARRVMEMLRARQSSQCAERVV
jgi:vanillate O-demethylase monooxygenase subunit